MPALAVRIEAIRFEAEGVLGFELRALDDGAALPAAAPGAHVELALADGRRRSYSLLGSPARDGRFRIAVGRGADPGGVSAWLHERARPGERLAVVALREAFPLVEDASHVRLVAGGIGITPFVSMIERLDGLGREWSLVYAARTPAQAAFREWLLARHAARVRFVFDGLPGAERFDPADAIADAPSDAHLYGCGPAGLVDAFVAACAGRPAAHVHVEYFSAPALPAAAQAGFVVELARTGLRVPVAPGQSILKALLDAGVKAPFTCEQGVCGACETTVLEGVPEHHDRVLSEAERREGRTMMICCSRSASPLLVLDR